MRHTTHSIHPHSANNVAFIHAPIAKVSNDLCIHKYKHTTFLRRESCQKNNVKKSCRSVLWSMTAFWQQEPRIAIVGAGIAGLSTALALIHTAHVNPRHIHLFDSRSDLTSTTSASRLAGAGAALNLSGGASILINDYNIQLSRNSTKVSSIIARAVSGDQLFSVNVEKILKNGNPSSSNCDSSLHTIMRSHLMEQLRDAVLHAGATINLGEDFRVDNVVIPSSPSERPLLEFQNGTRSATYDLVVGADGVRSSIRRALVGVEASASYTGFKVAWALRPPGSPSNTLPSGTMHQWFGNGGYILHYQAGPVNQECEILALSTRESKRAGENTAYVHENDIKGQFRNGLLACDMPQSVLDVFDGAVEFIETGVYSHKPTPKWFAHDSCVLVGDSGMSYRIMFTSHIETNKIIDF